MRKEANTEAIAENVASSSETTDFFFIDGESDNLDFIHNAKGSLPWANIRSLADQGIGAEPNNLEGSENCVE